MFLCRWRSSDGLQKCFSVDTGPPDDGQRFIPHKMHILMVGLPWWFNW